MDLADAEEYTQALGQVVAGGWRQIALGERLGVPTALGLTTRDWVDQRLGGYVRLSIPERREAVAELVNGEGMTQRQAADVLGVGKDTVRRDVDVANAPPTSNGASAENESDGGAGANAPPNTSAARKRASEKQRMAQLDADLVARIRAGDLSLEEAEKIHAQNERQVDAWANRVREGLTVLARMAGHPVPEGISSRLTADEGLRLSAVLHVLEPLKETP